MNDTKIEEHCRVVRWKSTDVSALLITCFYAGVLFGLFFDPENEGDMFFRNVGWLAAGYVALYPRG
jgi:hypothetical protein